MDHAPARRQDQCTVCVGQERPGGHARHFGLQRRIHIREGGQGVDATSGGGDREEGTRAGERRARRAGEAVDRRRSAPGLWRGDEGVSPELRR